MTAKPDSVLLVEDDVRVRHELRGALTSAGLEVHEAADLAQARDVDAAATLLGRNPRIAEIVNTHRFPLDAAAEAFEFARSDSESLKVVIEP